MRLIKQLIAVVAVTVLGSVVTNIIGGNGVAALVAGLITATLTLVVYRAVVRRTENRTVTEVSRTGAARSLGLGALIGISLFSLVIATIGLLGGYAVDGLGSPGALLGMLGFMAAGAVTEEVIFRGVLFRVIEERTGSWIAMAATGMVFGLMHLLNPNASLFGAIAIAVEAGFMLTAAYMATRRLWVPIGLHFGWNIAAGGIFSTEVSGANTPQGLLDATMSGPVLITGGDFGPEGSVFSIAVCTLAGAVFIWMAHRRDTILPPRNRRQVPGASRPASIR
ncbi:CPBP family intramembrane glutamic endopeptidase [Brevibacterium sp. UCMA 11754]|uniref:CPBP family intramembrane glutamic endopeptidase n=1 Tax=Brevibacterium sp. UCMA 11754 TaxID=2749198 RepID=UPI001F3EF511|nr:type II CAAX endopeptidase family protein [Brevibacterium sp. UCMA 11754]MCF2570603.1 CPBP family intramembrane metalloprotease [Brevibacterium sp. UCMA 11754]